MNHIEERYRRYVLIGWLIWCGLSVSAYLMTSTSEARFLILLGVIGVSCVILTLSWYIGRLTREYRHLNRLHKRMTDHANEAIAVHEVIWNEEKTGIVDYIFLFVNDAFEKMTGLAGSELIGRRILEALPATEDYWLQTYGDVVLQQKSVSMINYSKELDKYFKITAYPTGGDKFAVMFLDVTDTMATEIKLKEIMNKAKKADVFKTQFLKDVNHRLRTPLNGMMGMAQLLDRSEMSEGNTELFDAMSIEMIRSRNILNQIAEFVEVRDGNYQISKGNINEDLRLVCQELEICNRMTVDLDFDDNLMEGIYYEREVLRRVFQTIVANSLKHSKSDRLQIEMIPDRRQNELTDYLMICIRDFGIGIPEKRLELIFNEMHHEDFIHISREEGHTSLPLARELMRHIGGELTCSSSDAEGAVFIMKMPYFASVGR